MGITKDWVSSFVMLCQAFTAANKKILFGCVVSIFSTCCFLDLLVPFLFARVF